MINMIMISHHDIVITGGLDGGCSWVGTSPFCSANCPVGFTTRLTSKKGDGRKCLTGTKKLCCPILTQQLSG